MRSDSSLTVERLESIFRDREPGTEDDYKFFSVLVPVVRMRNGLHVLYEVRARHMTRQPGDVCFPGGEMETGETAMECALRETCEETGINQSRISVVNQLDTIYTYSKCSAEQKPAQTVGKSVNFNGFIRFCLYIKNLKNTIKYDK